MNKTLKVTLYLLGSLCWFVFAIAVCYFLYQYLTNGAGLQFLHVSFSPLTLFVGMVHLIGFLTTIGVCCAVEITLCLRAWICFRPLEHTA